MTINLYVAVYLVNLCKAQLDWQLKGVSCSNETWYAVEYLLADTYVFKNTVFVFSAASKIDNIS
jgi:hypothetical protein